MPNAKILHCIMPTADETRYAQTEHEMLAVVFDLEKFHHYVHGRHVKIITDHKPQVSLITVSNSNKQQKNTKNSVYNNTCATQAYVKPLIVCAKEVYGEQ